MAYRKALGKVGSICGILPILIKFNKNFNMTGCHPKFVHFNFKNSVMKRWLKLEFVRFEAQYLYVRIQQL